MLNFVIDTNVVMSMLISGKSHYLKLLSYYDFYYPQYLLIELDEYKNIIQLKTKMEEQQLHKFTFAVFQQLTAVPTMVLTKKSLDSANKLCEKIDVKDVSFVALSIETGFPLLTRDIPLNNGLKKQGFKHIILFEDFLMEIYNR